MQLGDYCGAVYQAGLFGATGVVDRVIELILTAFYNAKDVLEAEEEKELRKHEEEGVCLVEEEKGYV